MDRCSVFCTADIPTTTLNLFLQCTEEYLSEYNPTPDVSEDIVIIDTKDITTITKGSSPPITSSSPTVFLGHTLQEVHDWFDANITQPRPKRFMHHCFLVLDDKSAEDESCIFVCTQDEAPGEIHSLRCEFDVALGNAVDCHFGRSIEEGSLGCFMRSGVTMTKENLKLAQNRGCYIEGGEVKVDQAWRDFGNW